MSAQPTIGLLSPGDMGHAVGATLRDHGLRVITNLQGRSPRTAALAARAGIIDVGDDQVLVWEADIVLSIMVPSQAYGCAERVASAVQVTGTKILFADCNAIAPRTVGAIGKLVGPVGTDFVDVGIIGGPPRKGSAGPRLYVSGPEAERFALLRGACAAHVALTREALDGRGVNRHLLGLQLLLRPEEGENARIFEDPLFARSQEWLLSTSALSAGERFRGTGCVAPCA